MPISIGMTLFPSALRSDRPTAMGARSAPCTASEPGRARSSPPAGPTTPCAPCRSWPRATDASVPERAEPRLRWTDPHTRSRRRLLGVGDPQRRARHHRVPRTGRVVGRGVGLRPLLRRATGTGTTSPPWPAGSCRVGRGAAVSPPRSTSCGDASSTSSVAGTTSARSPRGAPPSTCGRWSTPSPRWRCPVVPADSGAARRPRPRRAIASETHVKVLTTAVGALRSVSAGGLRPVPTAAPVPRPLPARQGRLVPVPAAEAHVRLVSSIEEEADSVARHPSRWTPRPAWDTGPVTRPHPAVPGPARDLKPMPSAEPLPKPSVIEPRAGSRRPPRRAPAAPRPTPRRSDGRRPAETSRWSRSTPGARRRGRRSPPTPR